MDDDLIAAHGEEEKLMPFLHLPVQSGSPRMLEAMNRRHDVALYLGLVEKLRRERPDIALSSDFIVGFPGESEADFKATLDLVEAVRFASAFSFKYSPRPGTPAAQASQVAEELKAARLAVLQEVLATQQRRFNDSCRGRILPVLFDRPGRHSGQLIGRSPYLQSVHVEAPDGHLGMLVPVRILAAGQNSVAGTLELRADAAEASA
jgi:tRNA-2-methylthio-N6-dimethylallyladenosine synthase